MEQATPSTTPCCWLLPQSTIFFYVNKVEKDKEAREGMFAVIKNFSTSLDHEDLFYDELSVNMLTEGDFWHAECN